MTSCLFPTRPHRPRPRRQRPLRPRCRAGVRRRRLARPRPRPPRRRRRHAGRRGRSFAHRSPSSAMPCAADRRADVIVHGINPIYTRWDEEALPAARVAMDLAERFGARFMLPGNVYNYGEAMPELIDETTPQRPTTAKGRIRLAMETELERRAAAGRLRSTVITAGDFFGAGSGSWFDAVVAKSIAKGRSAIPAIRTGPRLGLAARPGPGFRRRRFARRPRAVRALRLRRALGDRHRIPRCRRARRGDPRPDSGTRLASQRACRGRCSGSPASSCRSGASWPGCPTSGACRTRSTAAGSPGVARN